MRNEELIKLIIKSHEKLFNKQLTKLMPEITETESYKTLDLKENQLTELSQEIGELENLKELNLSNSQLDELPPEIRELKNLEELNLYSNQLTQLPPEIGELKNLSILNLSNNHLANLPPEIRKLKNLTTLYLSNSQLTQLPPEIGELKNLKELYLYSNQLTQLPPEIGELKNLTTLSLYSNQLIQLPPEIGKLKNLNILHLSNSQLTQLPPEIGELKNLTTLYLSNCQLAQLPQQIGKLKNLTTLYLDGNQLTQLPPEIGELKNLRILDLDRNQLIQLPPEIGELKNLNRLHLSNSQLTQLPPEIGELKKLKELYLYSNQLTQLPPEIGGLENLTTLSLYSNQLIQLSPEIEKLKTLKTLDLSNNPLTSPPPEIVARGLEAIFTYMKQSKTTEINEAKLILVGNGEVGKTCLAYRLIHNDFLKNARITEGINISKWEIPAPDSVNSKIKLNIWDFGGQEIYHATHQFFLTKRSLYLLLWNARKTKDYDNIYYWLHTIEAFGEDSPIILVMSKMNESNDDLNLKDLRSKFPQIVGYLKIDSCDGTGINGLKETISKTAWHLLPLMRTKWVDSWFKVRQKLENLNKNWISADTFYKICKLKGLDTENINVLDDYLNDLGVILHFKDRLTLKNIVILKPEWATGAFYKILSTKYVLDNEGVLSQSELSQMWDTKTYPPSVHPQIMELMNKFELSYELPDKNSYLIPELLPKEEPDNFEWNMENDLCFYYCYDYFLPPGIIPRFIVRMHEDIEKKENRLPLCWREGAVLKLQDSRALVKMKPDERQIEIRVKGDNKRGALGAICDQLDQINTTIKKIKFSKQIPCNCSENCPERYTYEILLKAEMNNVDIQCHDSLKHISVSLLLDGYKRREERFTEYNEISRHLNQPFLFSPNIITNLETKQIMKAEQRTEVNTNININLSTDLPQIRFELDKLKDKVEDLSPKLDSDLDKTQDSLDEVSINSEKEKFIKPFNKLNRLLIKLGDPNSEYNKLVKGTEKGIEYAQKLGKTYNKFAQWLAMPTVPDLFLGK